LHLIATHCILSEKAYELVIIYLKIIFPCLNKKKLAHKKAKKLQKTSLKTSYTLNALKYLKNQKSKLWKLQRPTKQAQLSNSDNQKNITLVKILSTSSSTEHQFLP
jgi:hypothetical protein